MANRPSRSSSIPIPRSNSSASPSRNIESIISIPFATPGRARLPSNQEPSARGSSTAESDYQGAGTSNVSSSASMNTSTSPSVRPTARSFTQPSLIHARTARTNNIPFEPRVVRAESSRNYDSTFQPPTSPTSVRKPNIVGVRAPSTQRTTQETAQSFPTPSTPFERPAYLEHSAFRHLLQTEAPSSVPARKAEPPLSSIRAYSSSTSTDSDDDSNASPPPREIPTASTSSTSAISSDQVLKLPTRWSVQFRHHILSLSEDGRELTYQGTGSTDRDREAAAAARTIQHIPPACGIYYYEVEIRSKGQKAHISIGFAGSDVRTSRLPGWEPNSWGYHGDDGCSFAAEKNGTKYGPTFGVGDVIGCGVDFTTNRAFYTKNGVNLGPVFENVGKGIDLYPSVGLQHVGESVKVNFGHEPFRYDIEYYVQQQRNQLWAEIIERPIDTSYFAAGSSSYAPEEQTKRTLNRLVLSYLAHHGYVKTSRAFQKQAETLTPTLSTSLAVPSSSTVTADHDVEMADTSTSAPSSRTTGSVIHSLEAAEIELRTRIVNSILERDIDSALSETQKCYPAALEAEEGLMKVKLRCRKFIELLLVAAEMKKSLNGGSMAGDEERLDGEGEDGMGMEVDDDAVVDGVSMNGFGPGSPTGGRHISRSNSAQARCKAALNEAIAYGQSLENEYRSDKRPEVQAIFKRTFSVVAYEDPLAVGGSIVEVVGHEARVQLANELNQAILKSQGKPTHPPLEMMYRYAAVYLLQLGLSGVGAAAFADIQKELLDSDS
ncbi:SPRY-domain-containing protein [Marasmius fiardii PR-910]|nr:SPRY-domain-containing protein [Marasmius fiardii PR-910]